MDEDDAQFWCLDLDDDNLTDLRRTMKNPGLVGLVDEAQGGIVAYIIAGQEASLLAHLGVPEDHYMAAAARYTGLAAVDPRQMTIDQALQET